MNGQFEGAANANYNNSSSNNPYVQYSPVPKRPMDDMLESLSQCGKRVEVATKRAEAIADSVWHHLRMSPSLTEAAMARLNQGTKVLTGGGKDKVFQQEFENLAGEKLLHSYAC